MSPSDSTPRSGGELTTPVVPVVRVGQAPVQSLPVEGVPGGGGGNRISLAALWRYRWSILFTWIAASAVGVPAVWLLVAPKYTATAKIEVSPVIPQLVTGKSDMVPMYESYRSSQLEHITGMEVINAVLDRASVRATHWYRGTPVTPLERMLAKLDSGDAGSDAGRAQDRLFNALEVSAPKYKQHIFVAMSCSTQGEAKLIVDAVVEEYTRFANKRASDSELDRLDKLRAEVKTREAEINQLQGRQSELRERIGAEQAGPLLDQRVKRLDELNARMRLLSLQLSQQAESAASKPADAPATSRPVRFDDDREWRARSQAVADALRQRATAPEHLGADHPDVVRLQKAVDYAEEQLRGREQELEATGVVASATPEEARTLRLERDALKGAIAEEQEEHKKLFRAAEELRALEDQRAGLERTLQELRREQERIEMNRQVAGSIRAWAAYEPGSPADDKRMKMLAAAPVGALALAVGIALLRHLAGGRVSEVRDAPAQVRSTFLGYFPLERGRNAQDVFESPLHQEAVRVLRTSLLQRLNGTAGGRVVQITSAGPSSGKSTLSAMLGRSLAESGKRVLLVDADIRKPSLDRYFAVEGRVGLMDLLTQRAELCDVMVSSDTPSLTVVGAGAWNASDELELLANGKFSGLLRAWRAQYDLVLLDSGPLLGMADSMILARQADGTLMVVRENHCRRGALADALDSLASAGGTLLGTVYVGGGRKDIYGYGYGYGYGRGPAQRALPRSGSRG